MNKNEIFQYLSKLSENLDKENFIYDFLLAFGLSKTTITRLRKGDYNLSKEEGVLFYKNKIYFKVQDEGSLIETIDELSKDDKILRQKPRFIVVTDFQRFFAIDTKLKINKEFVLSELADQTDFFLPLSGAEIYRISNNNELDRNAAYKLGELYDILVTDNPDWIAEGTHELNVFLSRLLFCFFAEDTGIFAEKNVFTETLINNTKDDGSDIHLFLDVLFRKLNTKPNEGTFPKYLDDFPYVNGGLFKDIIQIPKFSPKARQIFVTSGELEWAEINPDIFGSMIQAVADPSERESLSMHYTSVINILKLIKPLFLDDLYEEFESNKNNKTTLEKLLKRLGEIKFFDPACGSGNFLIITYKELRNLEIQIIKQLIDLETQQKRFYFSQIKLNQFYGIEIKDFAHEIAVLSLWLAEHQMNQVFEQELLDFGKYEPILPLSQSGNITRGNATRMNWESVCPKNEGDEIYIIGNPPYSGYSKQNDEQKIDMSMTFAGIKKYKKLDYIACWFYKASQYIVDINSKYAFVSTNSITQGEQVALLWPIILKMNQEIFFAHQSFKWENNAKANAGVSVVIIGIRMVSAENKFLYDGNIKQLVKNISPYLTNTANFFIGNRSTPLSQLPTMIKGSSPGDNGYLLLDKDEIDKLINSNIKSALFLKKYIGAQEFLDITYRYCIYVTDENIREAYEIQELVERFEKVKAFRLGSKKLATQKKAKTPHCFDEDKYQEKDFILMPQTTSELREYIPVGIFDSSYVPSNGTRIIYNSEPWLFGMLASKMHMIWTHTTSGRLETRIQYTNTLCYNTFPFPNITIKQKESLNLYVFSILDERAKYPEKTIAQLYDPITMPLGLKHAHRELDEAIERCYRLQPFSSDSERLEYLLKLYEEMLQKETLFAKEKKSRKKK